MPTAYQNFQTEEAWGEKLVEEISFHGQPLKKLVLRASNNWDMQMCHTHIYPVEKTIY